jgi:hypothetical protein
LKISCEVSEFGRARFADFPSGPDGWSDERPLFLRSLPIAAPRVLALRLVNKESRASLLKIVSEKLTR